MMISDHLRSPSWIGLVLPMAALVLTMLVLIPPALEPRGSVTLGDGGVVGGHEHSGEISAMRYPFSRLVYSRGDVYCHQKESRTLFINGNPMPVCSRDLAIFIGIFLGGAFASVSRHRFNWAIFFGMLFPLALDGLVQALTPYESVNSIRIITGILGGAALSWMVGCGIMFVWGHYPPKIG